MATAVGVSTAYINLLENNQRSLSVKVLMSIADAYGVDWRDLIQDGNDRLLADIRTAMQDPLFNRHVPDLQELRAAVDHAPMLVENFLNLYRSHSNAVEQMMHTAERGGIAPLITTPEVVVHDFFRSNANYFTELDEAAEKLRDSESGEPDDVYHLLKSRLKKKHHMRVSIESITSMPKTLRLYDKENGAIRLSEALDFPNRIFQLAHMLGWIEFQHTIDALTADIDEGPGRVRCRVELANYFAAAYLMPYTQFKQAAESLAYDIDRLCTTFGVSFEQVCHRMTTLQRDGARGIPFFFIRVDRAGNVTKRITASGISIADHGGACPVWDLHAAFSNPGTIFPQFIELPDGKRFFTISRTADRPAYSRNSQARRHAISLGCEISFAQAIGYAQTFNREDENLYTPIGIHCRICPRQSCAQRAHDPMVMELSVDPSRRGDTRLES